MKPTGDKI